MDFRPPADEWRHDSSPERFLSSLSRSARPDTFFSIIRSSWPQRNFYFLDLYILIFEILIIEPNIFRFRKHSEKRGKSIKMGGKLSKCFDNHNVKSARKRSGIWKYLIQDLNFQNSKNFDRLKNKSCVEVRSFWLSKKSWRDAQSGREN